jgi:hypothetical protein
LDQIYFVLISSLSFTTLALVLTLLVKSRKKRTAANKRAKRASPTEKLPTKAKPFNPLRGVSFRDLLNHESISEKVSANAFAWIENALGKPLVSDTKKGSVEKGDAFSTRRLIETATALAPSMIMQTSPIIPVVIGCVQLVANLDKLKPFKKLDEKLGQMLELRSLDRLAHLQAVFEELKTELSTDDRDETHMRTLRLRLKEIRLSSQNEILMKLMKMEPPLPKAFLWWKLGTRKRRADLRDQILTELLRLREVQIGIHLEQLIWISLGQSDIFIEEITPDIIADLKRLGDLSRERIEWARGAEGEDLQSLDNLPEQMAKLLEFPEDRFHIYGQPNRKVA